MCFKQLQEGAGHRGLLVSLCRGRLKHWSDVEIPGMKTRESGWLGNRGRLDEPEACPLVTHRIMGNAFPNKVLNPLSMVAAEFQKANRKLIAGYPDYQC